MLASRRSDHDNRRDVPAWRLGEHPLRQWFRDDLEAAVRMGRRDRAADPVQRPRLVVGEGDLARASA